MGIQINGNDDIISALDGSWTAEGASINTSGILTATTFEGNVTGTACTFVDGNFTGNVTVGGTLTYEDVTNIDSVGVVTARTGVVSPYADVDDFISVGSNIHLGNAGIVTASSYRGDGSQLTGITGTTINNNANDRIITGSGTANTLEGESNVTWNGTDFKIGVSYDNTSRKLKFNNGKLEIYSNGDTTQGGSYIRSYLHGLYIGSQAGQYLLTNLSTFRLAATASSVKLYSGGNVKLQTSGTGVQITSSSNGDGINILSGNNSSTIYLDANRTGANNGIGQIAARWNGTTVGQIAFNTGSDTTDKNDGYIWFGTESAASNGNVNATERMRIHSDGKLSVGTASAGYGQWSFINIGSSGADAAGGETGLTIRSDEGFTNTDVTGFDNWTLKLRNNAYSGGGVTGNQGTVSKILFSAVTSNGHNSAVSIGCDTRGTGGSKGDFFVVPGGGSEALRIKSGGEVRIGTNSAAASTAGDDLVIEGSSDRGLSIISGTSSSANIYFGDSSDTDIGRIAYQHNDNALDFSVNAAGTVLRMQSDGNLRWYPDGTNGVNMYLHSNGANAITYAVNKNGTVATTCAFKNQNSSGQSRTWMEVNGDQQISIPYGMGGTDYLNVYVGTDVTKGINIMGQDGGNQNSDSGKIHFNGYAQTNGPWIWGENTLAWGKKDLVFGTVSTTNDYTTEVGETLRMTKYGDVQMGISPNNTLWDSNNNEQGMYYRRSEGSFAMATRSSTGYSNWYMNKNTTGGNSDNRYIDFYWNSNTRGSITGNGSNTAYNTSSDYRLKENIVDITDGITRLKQLKPRRFNWIHDSTNTIQDGFIAHEVSSFIPEAVTGTKDRVVTQAEVDADTQPQNDPAGTPVYQQMDYAKVTPLLTAALQELIAKVETLEAKVAALESS